MLWRLALFAEWLDRHRRQWCWADIATDLGFGWDVWHWRENARSSARRCWKECDELGSCWCGKFHQTEQHRRVIWDARAAQLKEIVGIPRERKD